MYLKGPDLTKLEFFAGRGKIEKFLFISKAAHSPKMQRQISAMNKKIFSGSTCAFIIRKITQVNCKITIVYDFIKIILIEQV